MSSETRWTDAIETPYLRCLIVNGVGMARPRHRTMSLAGVVSYLFGIGHTHATELCQRAGFDPYKAPTRAGKCIPLEAHP